MIYSYSKRQLFEYAHCLPDDSASVIHVETDSIYFNRSLLPAFKENLARYEGEYGCEFGSVLGSVKVEMDTDQPSYFLNKKFYTVHDGSKHKCVAKGIPAQTITEDGTKVKLLDLSIYERVYAHQPGDPAITVQFASMVRRLQGVVSVKAVQQTRTINSLHCYKEYQ